MLIRDLFENTKKTAVVAFGRFNPPTIGHGKIIEAMNGVSGDPFLFVSHTQDSKKNPLSYAQKVKYIKLFYPNTSIGDSSVRTPFDMMRFLEGQGYTDVVYVAGSDRVTEFKEMFDKYNGIPAKNGEIPYTFDSITVISAGERDADGDGVEGMSASKLRDAALNNDYETFLSGVPDRSFAKELFNDVRAGLKGVKETEVKSLGEALGGIPEKAEIYVDMDGVLADFFGEWAKVVGVSNYRDIPKDNIDAALQKIRDTDSFWLDLPMTAHAKDLLNIIKQVKGKYKILSSPLAGDPKSEPHKKEWINNHLQFFMPEEIIITHNKPKYATQEDGTPNILIDDYGVNIAAWEAAGGIGIKHKDHKFQRTADRFKTLATEDAPVEKIDAPMPSGQDDVVQRLTVTKQAISNSILNAAVRVINSSVLKKYNMEFIFTDHAKERIQTERGDGYVTAYDLVATFTKFIERYGKTAHSKPKGFEAIVKNPISGLNIVYVIDQQRNTGRKSFAIKTIMKYNEFDPIVGITNAVYTVTPTYNINPTPSVDDKVSEADEVDYRANYLNSDVTPDNIRKLANYFEERTLKGFKKGFNIANHKIDQAQNPRGERPLLIDDIKKTLTKFIIKYGKDVYSKPQEFEGIIKDTTNNLNMPFVIKGPGGNRESDILGVDKILIKTIMVKRNFGSNNPNDTIYEV